MRREKLGFILCGTFFVFQASVASDLDDFDPFGDDWSHKTIKSTPPLSENDECDDQSQKDPVASDDETDGPVNPDFLEDFNVLDGFGHQGTNDHDCVGSRLSSSHKKGSSLLALSFGKSPHSKGLGSKTPHSSPHPSQVMSPVRGEREDRPSSTPPVGSMGDDGLLASTPPRIFNISNPILIIKKSDMIDPFQFDQDEVKGRRLRSQSRNNPEKQLSRSKDPFSTSVPNGGPLGSSPITSVFAAPLHGHD